MLSEAASASDTQGSERPLKRRKTAQPKSVPRSKNAAQDDAHDNASQTDDTHVPSTLRQTVYDDSEDSEESDVDWEEIGLRQHSPEEEQSTNEAGIKDVSVVIGASEAAAKRSRPSKRRAPTAIEKKVRLEIHKVHVLCLLAHVFIRNSWCNDLLAQLALKRLLPPRTVSYLTLDANVSQFQRDRSFNDALQEAHDIFRVKFNTTALGLRKAHWAESDNDLQHHKLSEYDESPMERADFRKAAVTLKGSVDIGAQLFCTLLRAAGVEARLVCSLQPLNFGAAAGKSLTPRNQKMTILAGTTSDDPGTTDDDGGSAKLSASESVTSQPPKTIPPGRRRRIGQPSFGGSTGIDLGKAPPTPVRSKPKRIHKPTVPVYWVEAFNTARQKWVPVDPLITGTVGKAAVFEPPASYEYNNMSYVIAFEDDGVAKDVTRRYARAYNAKTRKLRVESTEGGEKWWKRAMKIFKRSVILDRDQVEDTELAKKEAAEGLPKNVQDFKDHPHYALERHLKQNEVIHPKREVGKVNAGKTSSNKLEPVYRRRDVHVLKSAEKWYRFGREVRPGEQPLKRVQPRNRRDQSSEDPADEDGEGVGLYAYFQTELYVPPPVVRGQVPRNAYGNLDVYVPSMVPNGGVHIRSADAAKAARVVGIDYADAVTGFQFKGRHGTAVTQGVVVAAEYRDAVEAVINGFEYAREEKEEAKRTAESLRMWKRFMVALRIMERVKGYEVDGEEKQSSREEEVKREMEKVDEGDEDGGGGFFPDRDQEEVAVPTASRFRMPSDQTLYGHDSSEHIQGSGIENHIPGPRVRRRRMVPVNSDEEVESTQETSDDETFMPGPRVRRKQNVEPGDDDDDEDEEQEQGDEDEDMMPGPRPRRFRRLPPGSRSVPSREKNSGRSLLAEAEDIYSRHEDPVAAQADADSAGRNDDGGGGFFQDATEEEGGGFVRDEVEPPELLDDYGGGFIPEEREDDTEMEGGGGGFVLEEPTAQTEEGGGGFVVEGSPGRDMEIGDAIGLSDSRAAPANSQIQKPEVVASTTPVRPLTPKNRTSDEQEHEVLAAESRASATIPREPHPPSEPLLVPPLEPDPCSSADERGSLISHDPEEEDVDVDVEWLSSD